MTPRQPELLQPRLKGKSLAELLTRQPLGAWQVVDVAADIAKQIALLHHRGSAYGALGSHNIRISGGRASLAAMDPVAGSRAADDVRDFAVWLRGLVQALPEASGERRRSTLSEIAVRYLQPESAPVSTQMRKAAMALSLLRVTSHSMPTPEAAPVNVKEPAAHAKSARGKKVLLLVRAVSEADKDETAVAKVEVPSRNAPWYAATTVVAFLVGALFYLMRRIL